MHIDPLAGRDPRLPEAVYGYLSNPLLQENLSFIPLATCFEYAARPEIYDPEKSWRKIIEARFGDGALPHWRTLRRFFARIKERKDEKRPVPVESKEIPALSEAHRYVMKHRREPWAKELSPWMEALQGSLTQGQG
jgi:hypothetical protein